MTQFVQQVANLTPEAFNDYGVYFPEDGALYMYSSEQTARATRDRLAGDWPDAYVVRVQIERV